MNKGLFIGIGLLLFALSTFFSYSYFGSEGTGGLMKNPLSGYKAPLNAGGQPIVNENEPKTEECPLNGEILSKSQKALWEKRRPLGVMIENHTEARPQSGLSSADIVYEAVAEGGITRFLAVFYCKDAPFVGPVRSARMHFIAQLAEYGDFPLYAHVGGANCDKSTGSGCKNGAKADALGKIQDLEWGNYNDMNQFAVPFPYYWRDPDRLPGRATEHTVYSTTSKLWEYARTKRGLSNVDKEGDQWDKTFTKWKFKDDADVKGTVAKISFYFWENNKSDFGVEWQFDPITNTYKRSNGGAPHIDKNTNKQITAKNVVIAFEDESPANDGYDGGHLVYGTTGSGEAIVFQDGQATKGTWKKKDFFSRIRFYDASGKEVAFNRGKVFIEIVPTGNVATY